MPSGCLFCKRKQRLFRINMVYDHTGTPIRNYIIEFLGPCEQYLHEEQGICSACDFVLNKLLYIRKCMFLIVASSRNDVRNNTPHFKFSYVYKHFLENLHKLSYEECDTEADYNLSELLRPLYTSPYHDDQNDREVQNTLQRKSRRRRRGKQHNFTRRKSSRSKSKSRRSTYSEPTYGNTRQHSSVMNFSECYDSDRSTSDNDNDTLRMPNAESHQNGLLRDRGTSVSTIQDDVTVVPKYKCISGCSFEFDNLKDMTDHKVDVHGMLANYICYECYATKFVSAEDLKLHNDLLHHTLITHCLLCSLELRTVEKLQKHLREHRLHSFRCNYCDLFFLDRRTCKAHITECHKGKRKRNARFTQCRIKDRIQRSDETFLNQLSKPDEKYNNKIIWRLQNASVKKLSTLCINAIARFYKGTVDITSLMKSSYYSSISNNRIPMEVSDNTNESRLEIENEPVAEKGDQVGSNEVFENIEDALNSGDRDSVTVLSNSSEERTEDLLTVSNGMIERIGDNTKEGISTISEAVEQNTESSNTPGTSGAFNSAVYNQNKSKVVLTTMDSFEKFVQNNNPTGVSKETKNKPNSKKRGKPIPYLNNR